MLKRKTLETGVAWLIMACLPVVLFATFFHIEILDIRRVHWLLEGDWGQHVLGWHAYRYDDGFNRHDLLAYPSGLSILYTDSNPLFSLPLKLLRDVLPANMQFIGPWFLFCLILHVVFAERLLRPHVADVWVRVLGVMVLSAVPALYMRIGHDTLFAHWTMLWALGIFFNARSERSRAWQYAACLGITSLIHPYLLFILLVIFGADCLRVVWPLLKPESLKAFFLKGLRLSLPLIAPILGLALGGAFGAGNSAGADGFGLYSMSLDAPINPAMPGVSAIIPPMPQGPLQTFEGFQYLGLGLLGLLILLVVLIRSQLKAASGETLTDLSSEPVEAAPKARLADVLPIWSQAQHLKWPFIVLIILAVSTHVQIFGVTLIKIPLPWQVTEGISIVRASGRLLWPVVYLGLFLSVVFLATRPRAQTLMILSGVLALQLLDLQPMIGTVRAQTAAAVEDKARVPLSPTWDGLIASANQVQFIPPSPDQDKARFYAISWQAVRHKVPVNTMYMARENMAQKALEQANYSAFEQGQIDPKSLYVFLTPCDAPKLDRNRLRQLDGFVILAPQTYTPSAQDLARLKPAPTLSPLSPKASLSFSRMTDGPCRLDHRWRVPLVDGTWTDGAKAGIWLDFDTAPATDLILTFRAQSFSKPRQTRIQLNGVDLGTVTLTKKAEPITVRLPAKALKASSHLEFDVLNAQSPAQMNKGRDTRPWGFKLIELSMTPASAPAKPANP